MFLEKYGYGKGTLNPDFINPYFELLKTTKKDAVEEYYDYMFEFLKRHNLRITLEDFLYGVNQIDYNNDHK